MPMKYFLNPNILKMTKTPRQLTLPQTYQNKSWSYAKGLANDENSYSQK